MDKENQTQKIRMNSPTYGKVDLQRIVEIIRDYINQNPDSDYEITIGTDSQNFNKTKIVSVIAVLTGQDGITTTITSISSCTVILATTGRHAHSSRRLPDG